MKICSIILAGLCIGLYEAPLSGMPAAREHSEATLFKQQHKALRDVGAASAYVLFGVLATAATMGMATIVELWKSGDGHAVEVELEASRAQLIEVRRALSDSDLLDARRAELLFQKDMLKSAITLLEGKRPIAVSLASFGKISSIKNISIAGWAVGSVVTTGTLVAIAILIARWRRLHALSK